MEAAMIRAQVTTTSNLLWEGALVRDKMNKNKASPARR